MRRLFDQIKECEYEGPALGRNGISDFQLVAGALFKATQVHHRPTRKPSAKPHQKKTGAILGFRVEIKEILGGLLIERNRGYKHKREQRDYDLGKDAHDYSEISEPKLLQVKMDGAWG